MTTVTLLQGDNRDHLRRLIDEGVRVHSVVTDPPYGLVSITKRFGKEGAAPARSKGATGVFGRAAGGFMGKAWDASGIERDPEFWALIWDILLPGGFCLAFSGARTGHWQACAMEQAGFIMHPMTGWVFGSGFPKAHDAAKAIDKMLGAEPTVIGHEKFRDIRNGHGRSNGEGIHSAARDGEVKYIDHAITTATTPEAAAWEGWAYGAQTMKPALEPIYVGQKPFAEKTGAANLLKHGVGAMNIDGCRVASPGEEISNHSRGAESAVSKGIYGDSSAQATHQTAGQALGRHPANLIHDGSEDVRALFPGNAGAAAPVRTRNSEKFGGTYGAFKGDIDEGGSTFRGDTGSAARFFNAFPVEPEALYYHAKASARDRVFQCQTCGTHGVGAKPACECPDRQLRGHPTVKPIGLMQHLVRLVTPPGGTVLDPFAGTGTTGAAARAEGFNCILMEADPEYCGDIKARLNIDLENGQIETLARSVAIVSESNKSQKINHRHSVFRYSLVM